MLQGMMISLGENPLSYTNSKQVFLAPGSSARLALSVEVIQW